MRPDIKAYMRPDLGRSHMVHDGYSIYVLEYKKSGHTAVLALLYTFIPVPGHGIAHDRVGRRLKPYTGTQPARRGFSADRQGPICIWPGAGCCALRAAQAELPSCPAEAHRGRSLAPTESPSQPGASCAVLDMYREHLQLLRPVPHRTPAEEWLSPPVTTCARLSPASDPTASPPRRNPRPLPRPLWATHGGSR